MEARVRGRRTPRRSGNVLVLIVLSLSVIVGVVAINLDGGRLLEERRSVQSVADAAALAAGGDLYAHSWTNHGQDPAGTAKAAALALAAANGFPPESVTVNVPPQSGTYAGKAGYAEVIIADKLQATFGRIFTRDDLPVAGRGVARGQPLNIGLILLRPGGPDAFLNKALAFTMVNSPVVVDSDDPAAYDQPTFGVTVASRYDITGGYVSSGGAMMLGTIHTGVPPTLDPLAFLPVPDSSAAPVRSPAPLTVNSVLPTTLQPGLYQGGVHITGSSTVMMQPGVYIMEGGGFQVDGLATVIGSEVMVYNTTSPVYSSGPISVTSGGKVVLTAPLSGTYQGINFFQDRSLTTPVAMSGVGLTAITGVVYAVGAPASLTGLAAAGVDILGGAYVVDSMTVQGAGAINIDLNLNPPRVPDVRLVE